MQEIRFYLLRVDKIFATATDAAFDEWQNRHALSVNGKFPSITDGDILAVGERYGLGTAKRVLEEVKAAFGQ